MSHLDMWKIELAELRESLRLHRLSMGHRISEDGPKLARITELSELVDNAEGAAAKNPWVWVIEYDNPARVIPYQKTHGYATGKNGSEV
jgi:hypothetical protein